VHFDFQRKKEALKSKVDYYLELFFLILLVINFIETALDLSLQSQLQNEIYLQWIILMVNLGLVIFMFIWLTLRQFWDPLKNWAVFRQRADDYARMSQYYNATVAVDNQVNVNLLGAQQSLEPEITNVNDNYENYENTNETNNTWLSTVVLLVAFLVATVSILLVVSCHHLGATSALVFHHLVAICLLSIHTIILVQFTMAHRQYTPWEVSVGTVVGIKFKYSFPSNNSPESS